MPAAGSADEARRVDRRPARSPAGAGGAARRVEITGPGLRQPRGARRRRCSSASAAFGSDGHEFAAAGGRARARRRWSSSARSGSGVPEVLVASARAAMAPLAARFYGDPARELRVVGVTGTNGKTTTAYLVRALLEAAGEQCGLLGTVKSVIGGRASARWRARRRRRSTCRPTCARCSTAATARARWRSPRTRWSWGAPTRSRSRRRCSPTSPRTTSTSTRRWRTTSWPSGGCSCPRAERRRRRRA